MFDHNTSEIQIPLPMIDTQATVTAVTFAPTGLTLAAGLTNGTVSLYDLTSNTWGLTTGRLHPNGIQAIAMTPDDALVATCSSDGDVVITDARTGELVRRLPTESASGVPCIAISPDGRKLAAGVAGSGVGFESDGHVLIWSLPDFRLEHHLPIKGPALMLGFSRTRGRVAVIGSDVAVYALSSGKKIWSEFGNYSRAVAIAPDGSVVASAGRLWNIDAGKTLNDPTEDEASPGQDNYAAFDRDGDIVIDGSRGDGAYVYDGRSGKLLSQLSVFGNYCALSPDGTLLAAPGEDYINLYRIVVPVQNQRADLNA